MAGELDIRDTFKTWLTKINVINTNVNATVNHFLYDSSLTSGFSVTFTGGKLRKGVTVETIAGATFTLSPNIENIVCIRKVGAAAATLVVYTPDTLPTADIIPVASLVTNGATVATFTDLRTSWVIT